MPTALRSVTSWIAIACLAFSSLLPLASLAAAKSSASVSAMAICSTSATWQSPGSAPGQAGHSHCAYCSPGQAYTLDLPGSNIGAFHATSVYLTAQAPQRDDFSHFSRADNRARAPPG